MTTAKQRGWGDPDAKGYSKQHIVTITLNCGVKLNVRREVAHLFKGFFDELEAETGYSLADKGDPDDWGYNNRDIRGHPGVKSNHAWGLAVDGNSEENPMGNPRRTNYPVEATERLGKRWGLFWGYDYETRPDTMHHEFLGTPADVAKYPLGGVVVHPAAVTTPTVLQEDEEMLYVIIKIKGDAGRWAYFPATGQKMLITDELDKAEGGKGCGGVLTVDQSDLRAIAYPSPSKSPAA